jgi:hypothetical protein
MAAQWKSVVFLASAKRRFQKLPKIINAPVREFCFHGSVKTKETKTFPASGLPARRA